MGRGGYPLPTPWESFLMALEDHRWESEKERIDRMQQLTDAMREQMKDADAGGDKVDPHCTLTKEERALQSAAEDWAKIATKHYTGEFLQKALAISTAIAEFTALRLHLDAKQAAEEVA